MKDEPKEKIPLFRTWNQWYIFVIACLAVLILLFSLFTKHFS